jgi:hypothetical protein
MGVTAIILVVGNHEGKRPLARPRPRWEDNMSKNLRITGHEWLT